MPRPVNSTVGRCPCRTKGCNEIADVRRSKGHAQGAPYLVCPECGVLRAHGPAAQAKLAAYINANATWGEDGAGQEKGHARGTPTAQPTPARGTPKPGFFRAADEQLRDFWR